MGAFNNFLNSLKNKYRATIIIKDKTLDHGRITEIEQIEDKCFDCYFWRQGMARINIGQTFKTDASAYLLASPDSISTADFTKDCRVKIEQYTNGTYSDIGDFDFIYADDVGGMGMFMQVALKQVI